MVHLNRNALTPKQLEKLFQQLAESLGKLPAPETQTFLSELLGYEERVMLAKRLAGIILILEGKSLYRVSQILKISPSTAEKIQQKIEAGDYDGLIASLGKSKRSYHDFLETLDTILHLGGLLPHRHGLSRYVGLGYQTKPSNRLE